MAPPGGSLISDRYELGERLGSGGMSTVYGATDRVLERTVAVKILAEHLSDDEKFVARFRREALAVARLIHPNIVQVYDTGVDHDRHYIVMEYVEGRSVAQLLQRRGQLGSEVAVSIGVQSCAGLEYAHRQGIIHRDVKPGNLMVIGGPAGRPSTALARAADRRDDGEADGLRHRPGRGADPHHPGRIRRGHGRLPRSRAGARRRGDARRRRLRAGRRDLSDAHGPPALGGLEPRRARDPPRVGEPAPPTSYDSSVPETLSTAVLRALEGEVDHRYSTAKEFSAALRAGISGREPPVASDEAPTQALIAGGAATAATRAMDSPDIATPDLAGACLPPAPPGGPGSRSGARPAQQKPSGGSRFLRLWASSSWSPILAAVIAIVVLVATDAGQNTDIGNAISDEINEQIDKLEDLIRDNQ